MENVATVIYCTMMKTMIFQKKNYALAFSICRLVEFWKIFEITNSPYQ